MLCGFGTSNIYYSRVNIYQHTLPPPNEYSLDFHSMNRYSLPSIRNEVVRAAAEHGCYAAEYEIGKPYWKRIAKNIYATTREECEEKLKVLIAEMKKEIAEIKAGEKATNKG